MSVSGRDAFLVVGGDSFVGGGLLRALERRGHRAYASTRRPETVGGRRVLLDFESPAPPSVPDDVGCAFIVAAATNYDRCEKDPRARLVNEECIPRVVEALLAGGVFTVFVSTNTVFGGERPWPNEDDPHLPGIPYARQKAEAERVIRAAAGRIGAGERLSVVRLTKILDRSTSPLPAWLASWGRGEAVRPFSDLVFAPMSLRFVGEALATLGEKRIPGNLHLSGADNVTYVDLAVALARQLRVDPRLIVATTSKEMGVSIPFLPRYSGLGMQRTTRLSGIAPQPLADVVADLSGAGGTGQKGEP